MAWTTVRGQDMAVQQLRQAWRRGRLAHALLFVGPDGVGKRLVARELAKALNCRGARHEACDACPSCGQIQRGVHPDVHWLVPQGPVAAIGIDDMRALLGRLGLRPFVGRCQVAVLDGAERLTEEAANSILKTLEEPSAQVRWILLTSHPAQCLATIRSRCQTVRFRRLLPEIVAEALAERGGSTEQAYAIAPLAQGSLSRAVELLEQWRAHETIVAQLAKGQPSTWMEWSVPKERQEMQRWLGGSIQWMRDAMLVAVGQEHLVQHPQHLDRLRQQAASLEVTRGLDAGLRLIELADASEQLISLRLVGTLLREEWMGLQENTSRAA